MTRFNFMSRYTPQLHGLLRIMAGLLFLQHGLVKLLGSRLVQCPESSR